MEPDRLLLSSRQPNTVFVRLPSSGGMESDRLLLPRFTAVHSLVRFPSSGGMEPDRLLLSRSSRLQTGEVAEFRRDGARQVVVAEPQPLQIREVAEFRRDGARKRVVVEPQVPQVREVAEFWRDGARQVVAVEVQSDDPAITVRLHAGPTHQAGGYGQPVGRGVVQSITAGGAVERLDRGSVGVGWGAG